MPVNEYQGITAAAVVIVPGRGSTITFVAQRRGPFAGSWLLPGGRVEFGESLADTARRETLEESGCVVGDLDLVGVFEMRGTWAHGPYHLITFTFMAREPVTLPGKPTGDRGVGEVIQGVPQDLAIHPTVMRVLHEVGVAEFDLTKVDRALAVGGITLQSFRPKSLTSAVRRGLVS